MNICYSNKMFGSENMNSPIIAVEVHSEHLSWQLRDVGDVFRSGSVVEHQTLRRGHVQDKDWYRSAKRAVARTQKLLQATKSWGIFPGSSQAGSSILTNRRSGAHYVEVNWSDADNRCSRHWMRLRSPVRLQGHQPSSVRFVTGTCLFGRSDAIALLEDKSRCSLVSARMPLASPVERLAIRGELSAYEVDTACRLSTVINAMSASIEQTDIYVHVPVAEYVLFMLGQKQGPSSNAVIKEWLSAVEHRGALVERLFSAFLADPRPAVKLNIGSPIGDIVMPYLREAILLDESPSIDDVIDLVVSSGTAVGEAMKHWMSCRGDTSVGYYDLAQFGYLASVLVQLHGHDGLVVEVENPSEEPIFRAVSRMLKRDSKSTRWTGNLMAVYPHEQTIEPCEGVLDWHADAKGCLSKELFEHIVQQYRARVVDYSVCGPIAQKFRTTQDQLALAS